MLSVCSISTYVQDLKNKTIYTVALSIFNINLRSRSEEQNYLHGCSQYVQYQPTFKIWGTKLYTSAYPLYIQYQLTFKFWGTKLYTSTYHQYIEYQPTFKIRGTKLFTRLVSDIQYQPTFKIWGTKLFKRLALSIFNINLRPRSEELNYIHGCSQYAQYQPTFKIWGAKQYTSAYHQDIQYQPTFKIWGTKLYTRLLSVCSISNYIQDLRC